MDSLKKILIVEDDKALSDALKKVLDDKNTIVFTAADGLEGMKIALKEKPELIALDIIMPVVDGIEMLKKLRSDEWGKTAKVIMLTNLDSNDLLTANAVDLNVAEYIVKAEYALEDIAKKIQEHLNY